MSVVTCWWNWESRSRKEASISQCRCRRWHRHAGDLSRPAINANNSLICDQGTATDNGNARQRDRCVKAVVLTEITNAMQIAVGWRRWLLGHGAINHRTAGPPTSPISAIHKPPWRPTAAVAWITLQRLWVTTCTAAQYAVPGTLIYVTLLVSFPFRGNLKCLTRQYKTIFTISRSSGIVGNCRYLSLSTRTTTTSFRTICFTIVYTIIKSDEHAYKCEHRKVAHKAFALTVRNKNKSKRSQSNKLHGESEVRQQVLTPGIAKACSQFCRTANQFISYTDLLPVAILWTTLYRQTPNTNRLVTKHSITRRLCHLYIYIYILTRT